MKLKVDEQADALYLALGKRSRVVLKKSRATSSLTMTSKT